jgi:flagellar M-ring protein FliF
MQQSFQKQLEANLQVLLERVLGPGNVVTRVTAELNFDQKTIDKTIFQPVTDGILRSLQELEETYRGQGNSPAGVPGTSSNIPQYQSGGQAGTSDYQKKESTKNYEISEVRERTVVAPGSVKRLSVAVVVNKELDDAQRQAIEKMVGASIGLDAERKDQVTVSGMAFNNTVYDQIKKQMEDEKKTSAQTNQNLSKYIFYAGGGLLLLVVLVFSLRGRKKPRPRMAERATYDLPMSDRPKADVAEALAQAAQAAAFEEALKPPAPDPEQEKRRRLREEIERVARQNPENVAQLIKTWLAEERR